MKCKPTYKGIRFDSEAQLIDFLKINNFGNPFGATDTSLSPIGQNLNQVQYNLKAVEILSSDKAEQVFEKGKKNNWDLNKILTELQVPKEQKQIILDNYKNKVSEQNIDSLIQTGKVQFVDEQTGEPCLKHGGSFGFTKGGKWEIIKDFKGKSHKEGGIDVSINVSNGTIKHSGKNPKFKAQRGLILSAKTFNYE
jgi:hypothetical protein